MKRLQLCREALLWMWMMLGGSCRHELSWVFRDKDGEYQRCVLCGTRVPYARIRFERRTV